jgi:putative conjugative transposon mobilization protein
MAITKIHPIKATLNLAIEYITDTKKTDEQILVSTNKCHPVSAHTQFLKRREEHNIRGNVLARHLIQSFLPGETTPEIAHQIGLELCKKILKEEYEFILSTHIDKGHIHNHIIFNNVNMTTGKCYQSNKRSYHQIRYQSDKLCKEHNLSVIDEYYERFKKKYKTNGKSWYENEQSQKGNSWKSRLQFDIDRMINQSKDWTEFIQKMTELGYEIKYGKHIAFKQKGKKRFIRSRTIGADYAEDRIKERISESNIKKTFPVKKRIGSIIDIANNPKIQQSKGYKYWATKHNLRVASDTVLSMREKSFQSLAQLDNSIKKSADKRQSLQEKIKKLEKKIETLSMSMEQAHNVNKYHQVYQEYKKNPGDKDFVREHKSEILLYENALEALKKSYSKMPSSKQLFEKLEDLNQKKNTLMQEYSSAKSEMNELYQIRKNYEQYIGKNRDAR